MASIPSRKVIAKVPGGKIVTYRSRNIVSLFRFIQKKFGGCVWMNVYDQTTGLQLPGEHYVFSERNPPTAHV